MPGRNTTSSNYTNGVDKFEFRIGNMKAKLDQIRLNIGEGKKREDSEEARKYYEVSTHRGNQELDAD